MKMNNILCMVCLTALVCSIDDVYAQNPNEEEQEEPIKVTYQKFYHWSEPHYNVPLSSMYYVVSEKTYEDGRSESVMITPPKNLHSIFAPYSSASGTHNGLSGDLLPGGGWGATGFGEKVLFKNTFWSSRNIESAGWYGIQHNNIGVPDLSTLSWEKTEGFDGWNYHKGDYRKEAQIMLGADFFNPEAPVEAWYVLSTVYKTSTTLALNNVHLAGVELGHTFNDMFLYYDGQCIDFDEFKASYDADARVEDITLPDGRQAKVFTTDLQYKYLDRDFYQAVVDTVYQFTPKEKSRLSVRPAGPIQKRGGE